MIAIANHVVNFIFSGTGTSDKLGRMNLEVFEERNHSTLANPASGKKNKIIPCPDILEIVLHRLWIKLIDNSTNIHIKNKSIETDVL